MIFHAAKAHVLNRGNPSDAWLTELVMWGKSAPEEIFAANAVADDIYTRMRPILGPWTGILHRRAALLEAMRVHAGFESSWNWNEGVDTTNRTSMRDPEGAEAGAWQVSANSKDLGREIEAFYDKIVEHVTIDSGGEEIGSRLLRAQALEFQHLMKSNHPLAMEYYARLVRVNIRWAGPIVRNEFQDWLQRSAVTEFEGLLTA